MDFFKNNWETITLILGILGLFGIQINKSIKIEPLSLLLKGLHMLTGTYQVNKRLDGVESKVDDLYKTNDFNHATEIKSKMVAYKSLHQERYLSEDEWNRYNEQEDRYLFLLKKYPDELNGHMKRLIAYMNGEYDRGNVSKDLQGEEN